jgi:hypothetical protein
VVVEAVVVAHRIPLMTKVVVVLAVVLWRERRSTRLRYLID